MATIFISMGYQPKNTATWTYVPDTPLNAEVDFLFSDGTDFLFSDSTDYVFFEEVIGDTRTWTFVTKN